MIDEVHNVQVSQREWHKNETWENLSKLIGLKPMEGFPAVLKEKLLKLPLVLQDSIDNYLWSLHHDVKVTGPSGLYYGIMRYLHTCEKFKTIKNILSLDTTETRISPELTKVWLSIMQNYTLILGRAGPEILLCTSGRRTLIWNSREKSTQIVSALPIGLQRVSNYD